MGLDTYAVRPEKDADGNYPRAEPEHFTEVGQLCGGMFSGNGNDGSFRGKVYSHSIEEVTGVSLYQEFIDPAIVEAMSRTLDACDPAMFDDDDLPALRQFFAVCRE